MADLAQAQVPGEGTTLRDALESAHGQLYERVSGVQHFGHARWASLLLNYIGERSKAVAGKLDQVSLHHMRLQRREHLVEVLRVYGEPWLWRRCVQGRRQRACRGTRAG